MAKRSLMLLYACLSASQPAAVAAETESPKESSVHLVVPTSPGGLTADSAAEKAIRVAHSVRSRAAVKDRAGSQSSRSALHYLPSLSVSAGYTRLSEVTLEPFVFQGMEFDNPFPQVLDNYLLRASLRVPITEILAQRIAEARAKRWEVERATYEQAAEAQVVGWRARQSFYAFVRARAAEVVAQDSLTFLQDHERDLAALVDAGRATLADALQARAETLDSQVALTRAKGSAAIAADTLRALLDLEPGTPILIAQEVLQESIPAAVQTEALQEAAQAQRAEVRVLQSGLEQAEAHVDAVEGARWPALSFVGNLDLANPNPRIFPQAESFRATWDLNLTLSWSTGGFITAADVIDDAHLVRTQTQQELRGLRQQFMIEASQAAHELQVATEALASAKESVVAAQEAWRIRRLLLQAGRTTPSETLGAQGRLRRSQLNFIEAHIAVQLAAARIEYVRGAAADIL